MAEASAILLLSVVTSFLLLFWSVSFCGADEGSLPRPRVKVSQGPVEGVFMKSVKGKEYAAFRGIPYAEPPVGKLRFQAPERKPSWEGTLDASSDGSSCPQLNFDRGGVYEGSEDCLFLNVYTPKLPDGVTKAPSSMAVMVFFHGGAFSYGHGGGEFYGAGRLMDYDVILVTLNYRLGPLGYLSTGDESAPGNAGLLDQVAALQWVHDNIGFFGGDPLHVTLFGHSAGAASALFHIFSPLSKGLFHRVIAQSGSALCRWASQENPLPWAKRLAKDFGCPTDSTAQLVACLQTKDAKQMITKVAKYYTLLVWPMPFVPVIDHGRNHPFLNATPQTLIEEGRINRVPVIAGIAQDEGAAIYAPLYRIGALSENGVATKLDEMLLALLNIRGNLGVVADAVSKEYLDKVNMDKEEDFRKALTNLISDAMNKACSIDTLQRLSSAGLPTYMYVLTHGPSTSILKKLYGMPDKFGVCHGDELLFLFDGPTLGIPFTPEDESASQFLLSAWTTFARISVPVRDTPRSWVPLNPGEIHYLNISSSPEQVNKSYRKKKMKFWNEKIPKLEKRKSIRDEL